MSQFNHGLGWFCLSSYSAFTQELSRMFSNPNEFKDLLYEGITAIQQHESSKKKKPRKEIHNELGRSIDRQGSTIEYYLLGHLPVSQYEIERLARDIFSRGRMDEQWLKRFLRTAGFTNPGPLIQQLCFSQANVSTQEFKHQFKRLQQTFIIDFLADRSAVFTMKIQMQATSTFDLHRVAHSSSIGCFRSDRAAELDFIPIHRSNQGTFVHSVNSNTPDLLSWYIDFEPPLRSQEIAIYEYKVRRYNLKPWTMPECRDLYSQKVIRRNHCYYKCHLRTPVDHFYYRINFPPNYEIVLPSSGGFEPSLVSAEDLEEKTRLIQDQCFHAGKDEESKQWYLELSVQNPRLGYAYELQWIPPEMSSLKG
jgi:hypothetical protein